MEPREDENVAVLGRERRGRRRQRTTQLGSMSLRLRSVERRRTIGFEGLGRSTSPSSLVLDQAGRDRQEPGRNARGARGVEPREVAARPEEGLLSEVFHVGAGPERPRQEREHHALVPDDEGLQGLWLTR